MIRGIWPFRVSLLLMAAVVKGHAERLLSGSWRAVAYAGVDPLTGKEICLKATDVVNRHYPTSTSRAWTGAAPLVAGQAIAVVVEGSPSRPTDRPAPAHEQVLADRRSPPPVIDAMQVHGQGPRYHLAQRQNSECERAHQ
jgi:hypothetical protein